MSRILDKLQQAEEQRQRVIAERRRLEVEADAALAAHDRELRRQTPAEAPQPAAPRHPVRGRQSPAWGWAAALACLAVAVFVLLERKQAPARPEPAEALPASAAARPAAGGTLAASGLKLDRDLDAFAARLRDSEKP